MKQNGASIHWQEHFIFVWYVFSSVWFLVVDWVGQLWLTKFKVLIHKFKFMDRYRYALMEIGYGIFKCHGPKHGVTWTKIIHFLWYYYLQLKCTYFPTISRAHVQLMIMAPIQIDDITLDRDSYTCNVCFFFYKLKIVQRFRDIENFYNF